MGHEVEVQGIQVQGVLGEWREATSDEAEALEDTSSDARYVLECCGGKWYAMDEDIVKWAVTIQRPVWVQVSTMGDNRPFRVHATPDGRTVRVDGVITWPEPDWTKATRSNT